MTSDGGWASVESAVALAKRLPGHGRADVEGWLAEQLSRVGDPSFAVLFEEAAQGLGMETAPFSHRIVEAAGMRLLGGIRFFLQDIRRPFVELLAWDGPSRPSDREWSALREAAALEWGAFEPAALRLFHPTDLAVPEDAVLDLSLHAARYAAMRRDPAPCGACFPLLTDGTAAATLVAERYEELRDEDASVAGDLAPIEEEALEALIAAGCALGIEHRGHAVGLLAWQDTSVEWVRGDVVQEEVVRRRASGHGLAAAAQRELARRRAVEAPDTMLLGTILAANAASRRTALRAGRPEVARYSFLPLTHSRP